MVAAMTGASAGMRRMCEWHAAAAGRVSKRETLACGGFVRRRAGQDASVRRTMRGVARPELRAARAVSEGEPAQTDSVTTTISGKAYVTKDNIDTDQIIPAEWLMLVPSKVGWRTDRVFDEPRQAALCPVLRFEG